MKAVLDNPLTQFLVMLAAVIAGILAAKTVATRLPNGGVCGAIKTAVLAV